MESLISRIYHEKQQEGSMLCAQHALNSMLQGNYFTAPDLSAIAVSLDTLEQSYDNDNRGTSTNMDDTGFFSVQVLENALHVWGLSLLRWRSEALRPYQDRPHTQLGFILNLNQHWFTLRRFGVASPNPDTDQGQGHWFNLNSFLPSPEWVGKLYLSMVLQQAEHEGYSVFVVMQSDPDAPLALPRTDADDIASTIPEQASAPSSSSRISTSRTTANTLGFEDDVELQAALQDMDLQAALQASLMAHTEGVHSESGLESPLPLPVPPPLMSSAETRSWRPMASRSQTPTQVRSPAELDEAEDPVAATMARNRSIMQRMRMEQETALRESYEDIDMEQLRSRQRQSQEEEDMIQRAIAESEALHPLSRSAQDDAMAAEGDGPQPRSPPLHPQEESRRVYDDEDEELQAALRASLEDVPEGYRATLESPPPRMVPPPAPSHEWDPPNATNSAKEPDADDSEVWSETSSIASPEEEQITMEEMRRRRLAKFGA